MVSPPKIVNDTNVWLSALYFFGKPAQVVHLIEEKEAISITSNFILKELRDKMVLNFETPVLAANGTISYIRSISKVVSVKGKDFGLRDQDDNKVLETAVVGRCEWLITGDKDLLTLGKYQNIKIVTPAQFLEEMK